MRSPYEPRLLSDSVGKTNKARGPYEPRLILKVNCVLRHCRTTKGPYEPRFLKELVDTQCHL